MRRFDLGCASFGRNWQQLEKTFASIIANSVTDWKCYVCHNPSEGDELTKEAICRIVDRDSRFVPVFMGTNVGYAGACNIILKACETEYCGYLDNDAVIETHGWDEMLCAKLDAFHEVGIIFPNGGAYMIDRGNYQEILWGVGFCWVINQMVSTALSLDLSLQMTLRTDEQYDRLSDGRVRPTLGPVFDTRLGHQEEADVCQRVRMEGWKCAAVPSVRVRHEATSTNDPKSIQRINRGVVNWVNKWNKYFNGRNFNYHSPNVTRFEDWPPNALFLEEWWKLRLPNLNYRPEVVTIEGRAYDLIRVPRFSGFYSGRII